MKVNDDFIKKIQDILALIPEGEKEDFLKSFENKPYLGFRLNTQKTNIKYIEKIFNSSFEKVPWSFYGYYYKDENLSKSPLYHAGLYYLQEPSAMSPVWFLEPEIGDKVLDLCAAPGGKSTQIANLIGESGFLLSNDISPKRTIPLTKNIKLAGFKNSLVTCMSPDNLKDYFPSYFDKILLDAPCSGEGMLRKTGSFKNEFEIEKCVLMQKEIIKEATKMLKPGGLICYSTCTFNTHENESIISWILDKESNLKIKKLKTISGIEDGIKINDYPHEYAKRLWMHKIKGEGHFVCLLEKDKTMDNSIENYSKFEKDYKKNYNINDNIIGDAKNLLKSIFSKDAIEKYFKSDQNLNEKLIIDKDSIYYLDIISNKLDKETIRKLNARLVGVELFNIKNTRLIPSSHMALCFNIEDFKRSISFAINDINAIKYIKGETVFSEKDIDDGYVLVCIDSFPLGFGKKQGRMVKNLYEKSWRMM